MPKRCAASDSRARATSGGTAPSKKLSIAVQLSLTLTATSSKPVSPETARAAASSAGSSVRQGPHQVAQKWTRVALPARQVRTVPSRASSRSAGAASVPDSRSNEKRGAPALRFVSTAT